VNAISIKPHDIRTLYDVTIQPCHSERREESQRETLRFTQGDSEGSPDEA